MRSGQTAREIDDEAALWAIRHDGEDHGGEPDDDLQAWLAGDPRRSGALLRARAALSLVDRARALPGPVASPNPPLLQTRRRALVVGGAFCATIAATVAGLSLATRQQSYSTAQGEMRRVALEDGSIAEINTDTAFDVTMARRLRRIRLQRGEAWFTVAKDSERPFVVEASGIRVAAIGTAFSVYDAGAHTDVLVTEGVVEAWRPADKAKRVRVAAGSRLRVGLGGLLRVDEAAEGIERDLAWRSGQIDLAGRSLQQAVAEFNRYNRRGIYIDDPVLGQQTLVGLFRTNEPESFARSVALAFGASLTQTPQAIRLGAPTPSN